MSFVRVSKKENPFVQVDKSFIGNGTLSLKATGLLLYFLSKPDNWQIRLVDVQKRFNDGETSIRSALKELIEVGYVNRSRERNEKGQLVDYVYEVYERPEYNPKTLENKGIEPKRENHEQDKKPKRENPELDYPELDYPELDNHVHSNNDFSNNDFSNNESNNNHHHKERKKEDYIREFVVSQNLKHDDDVYKIFMDKITSCKATKKASVLKYCQKTLETAKEQAELAKSKNQKNVANKKNTRTASLPKRFRESEVKPIDRKNAEAEQQEFERLMAERAKRKEKRAN